jgi:hypothetical protein
MSRAAEDMERACQLAFGHSQRASQPSTATTHPVTEKMTWNMTQLPSARIAYHDCVSVRKPLDVSTFQSVSVGASGPKSSPAVGRGLKLGPVWLE